MQELTREQIEDNFKYHAPKGTQTERYELFRNKAKELAFLYFDNCPDSIEKNTAMMDLQKSVMMANASIARHE